MHVLLTGASGFLGAHALRKILNETDWTVGCPVTYQHRGRYERLDWAMTDTEGQSFEAAPGSFRTKRVFVYGCDLARQPERIVFAEDPFGPPDTIINFASDTHPPRSVLHPVDFTTNNFHLMLNLLEYARTLPALSAFVQISTDSVYGPAPVGTPPHREWDPIVPNNPYTASKAAQEALGIAWWRSYGLPLLIVATMNPMGETQDVEKFIPMTIGKVLRGEPVQIHATDGVPGIRSFIDADQVVDGILHLLRMRPPARFGGDVTRPDRWNVCSMAEIDNLTVAQTIADSLDLSLKDEIVSVDRPEHGHRYAMSNDKVGKTGWTPDDNIIEALQRTTHWFAEHADTWL